MRRAAKPRQAELTIQEYSSDGFGLASGVWPEGGNFKAEVPFTMPGDRVLATLSRSRSGVYQGRLEEILTPSPERVAARCVHFGVCGGCRWQHLPYQTQLQLKEQAVRDAFATLLEPDTQVFPIIPCDPPWEYRNKMEFSFSSDSKGQQFLGLMMREGRNRVLNLTECHLVQPWMTEAIVVTREWWAGTALKDYFPPADRGSLRTLVLRQGFHSGDRMAMLTLSGNPDYAVSKADMESWADACRARLTPPSPAHLSLFVRIQQIAKGRPTQFFEIMLQAPDHVREQLEVTVQPGEPARVLKFDIGPTAFFQPNPRQAAKLYSRALQMVKLSRDALVYDLCCGTGTLGIAIAPYVGQVIGIELSPEASLDARTNVKHNACDNVVIHTGDVGQVLLKLQQENSAPHPQLVIVDPPRSGLTPEAVRQIIQLAPQQILYISCKPTTQAVDVALLRQAGYRVVALQPVDQFPQTIHIENIVVLERRAS